MRRPASARRDEGAYRQYSTEKKRTRRDAAPVECSGTVATDCYSTACAKTSDLTVHPILAFAFSR